MHAGGSPCKCTKNQADNAREFKQADLIFFDDPAYHVKKACTFSDQKKVQAFNLVECFIKRFAVYFLYPLIILLNTSPTLKRLSLSSGALASSCLSLLFQAWLLKLPV